MLIEEFGWRHGRAAGVGPRKGAKPDGGFEALEPRLMFTAVPVISEFLASNDDVLDDEDGDSSDWVEVYNAGDAVLDLEGWYLTDRADDLTRWAFPAVSVDPGQYLVVFASNKDRADADGTELHTNFALAAGGEYLALVEDDGTTIAFEYAPEYPAQSSDVSYGLAVNQDVTTLVAEGANARYTVPAGPIAGWNTAGFNDSGWSLGPTGIGYEDNPADFASLIESAVPTGTTSVYLRQSFQVSDTGAFDTLTLGLRYDDGFVAYLNGVKVAEMFAPGTPQWNSTAIGSEVRTDPESAELAMFDLSGHLGDLVLGTNVLAVQVLNSGPTSSDLLVEPVLTAATTVVDTQTAAFMLTPTPGAANLLSGPIIESLTQNPPQPAAYQDLVIETSVVENAGNGIARVDLHYRVNYGSEIAVQVFDNGLGADTVAGDGVYTGVISSALYAAGDMVRWYATAEDDNGQATRVPVFVDQTGQDQDAQYAGTVVADPGVNTPLETLYWFVEDEAAAETTTGSRVSLFFNGKFYDNAFVRIRGNSSVVFGFSKPNFKFDFNGSIFEYADGVAPVEEFNVNTAFTDKSYVRQVLAYELFRDAGAAGSDAFPLRMQRNGDFYSLAHFVEQVDDDYLERNGLDGDGALYKAFNQLNTTSGAEKKTRLDEDLSDYQDLVDGVSPGNPDRDTYLFDNIDIPAVINHLAVQTLIHNNDHVAKNYYVYRDTEGTGEWQLLPWDLDLSFGRNYVLLSSAPFPEGPYANLQNDVIWADNGRFSHPDFADQEHPKNDGPWNRLIDAIHDNPTIQEMYLRRLRTLMHELLGAPGSSHRPIEDRLNELATQLAGDVALDRARWGNPYGEDQDLATAIDIIIDDYLPRRRDHLYIDHSVNNPGYPDNAGIPNAQPALPGLSIGTIEFNPAGGDQDQEYIQLTNNNAFAVDISGWTVEGAIAHTFRPGTVIASGQSLYITPSSSAFRARTTGPSGGQSLFIQQWDSGHLSSFGETVTIKRTNGSTAASVTYPGDPSPEQEHLRLTELHYNPAGPTASEQAAGFTDGDPFEFIELHNTSLTETLNLAGLSFRDGIDLILGGGPQQGVLLDADFAFDSGGFLFRNNAFNNTGESGVASGVRVPSGGNGGGALQVTLASADDGPDHGPSSGAFDYAFTLSQAGEVTITLDYNLIFGGGFESNEIGQAIAELDGIRLGSAANGSLASFTGDGNSGPDFTTGYQGFSTTLQLEAGLHTLSLGAYYNRSTLDHEDVVVFYDNVQIVAPVATPPVPLAPGARALLVSSMAAFTERYGQSVVDASPVIVEYDGNLSNGGERLKLNDANGSTILDFSYEDGDGPGEAGWPTTPDGDGPSLVVIDTEGDYDDGANWRASTTPNGTPGSDEAAGIAGDITGDGYVGVEDLDELLIYWGDSAASSPGADAADLNLDGTVGTPDLDIVLAHFGQGSPPVTPTSNEDPPGDAGSAPTAGGVTQAIDAGEPSGHDPAPHGQAPAPGVPVPDGGRGGRPDAPPATPAGPRGGTPRGNTLPDRAAPLPPKPKLPPVMRPTTDALAAAAQWQSRHGRGASSALDLARPKGEVPPKPAPGLSPAPQAMPRRFSALGMG